MPYSNNKETHQSRKGGDPVSRFHTRQALYVLIVFAVLIVALITLLAEQYRITEHHEEVALVLHFQELSAHLDSLLASVNEHVEGLRIAAEADLLQTRAAKTVSRSLEFQDLSDVFGENRFQLDTLTPPLTTGMTGNLTGEGSIQERSVDFYREIHMAFSLNPMFQATTLEIKNAAWVYYTSKNDFIHIYPWVSSSDFQFSKELHSHEFYKLGLPQYNPDRKSFWTPVYVDEYGKGLMTTCAVPVYDNDQFLGTVALDLTVDFLNTMIQDFNQNQGTMFLVNESNQLLAHPTLITSSDDKTKSLKDALPAALLKAMDRFNVIPDDQITRIGSFNVLLCHLNQTPWQIIYIEQFQPVWKSFINLIGVGSVIVLTMLIIMMVTVLAITHRQFIQPSKKFVNYIIARSRGAHRNVENNIPRVWKPWFSTIEEIFDNNEKLAQELKEQNEQLEISVKKRTADLEEEIEERKIVQQTLRRSEERFRDISYSMADIIWETDKYGKYTFASDTVTEIIGYQPKEILGKTPYEFMSNEDARRAKQLFNKNYSEIKTIVDFENWIMTKEGKMVCLLTNGVPIRDDSGEFIGYRGVIKNITDVKKAQKEQKELQTRLQRSEKMESLGMLAGGVAHDLNNILSGIVTYPDLLLMDMAAENPLKPPLETIKKSGVKAAAIVQDLLTLARRGTPTKDIVNLNDIVSEYINSPEYEKLKSFHPDVKIQINNGPDLLNILGSPVHLLKSVMNLVSNAAEAMPDGGEIIISIENRYIERPIKGYDEVHEGDYVTLTITDNGMGISKEDIAKIFEPFYTKKVMGRSGTGLGMAVVWGTVKDHNGYIDVDSVEKHGTTFTLFFPATRKQLSSKFEDVEKIAYYGNGESILVVDDMIEQREIAAMMFSKLGYSVNTVASGEEAIEYFKKNSVDLLVVDMVMEPGIDGFETYKKIVEISPGQKAIIVSGFSETERVKGTIALGAGIYIKKPYTLESIGRAAKEALSN